MIPLTFAFISEVKTTNFLELPIPGFATEYISKDFGI